MENKYIAKEDNSRPNTVHIEGIGTFTEQGSPDMRRLVQLLLKCDKIVG
ncbi:hypothetical protein [Paraliobacillus sp. X-1268]|nr:hypothetical protein [Paraliobacillus sp. X-1268]